MDCSSLSPAGVGETLRVVLASSLTPSLSSNPRMAWLNAEGEIPREAATLVKLRSRATAAKAIRSFSSPRSIAANCSQVRAACNG
jgi:hypothetical protein